MVKRAQRQMCAARWGCYQHDLVPAAVAGWFVCQACGFGAVCPGCVERVSGSVPLHLCEEHRALRAVEAYVSRMVWTVAKDSPRGGK